MELNSQNFSGMNVSKMQQTKGPTGGGNNNVGKIILGVIVLAIIGGGGYFAWGKYNKALNGTGPRSTATSTIAKMDNSTSTGSISADIDTASKFDNSANMNAIDQEFK